MLSLLSLRRSRKKNRDRHRKVTKKGDFFQNAYAFVETMAYAGRMKKDSSTLLTQGATQQGGAGFLAITYFYRAHFLSLALVLHAIVLYHIYAKKRRHHGLGGRSSMS